VELPLHPWDEADLVLVNDAPDVLWIPFAIILLKIFVLIFIKEIGL
jgi:bacteriorhodopsin